MIKKSKKFYIHNSANHTVGLKYNSSMQQQYKIVQEHPYMCQALYRCAPLRWTERLYQFCFLEDAHLLL